MLTRSDLRGLLHLRRYTCDIRDVDKRVQQIRVWQKTGKTQVYFSFSFKVKQKEGGGRQRLKRFIARDMIMVKHLSL